MSSLSSINYLRPQSHTQKQTKWVLGEGQKIFAPSLRILDLMFSPNRSSYFPALTGAYACISKLQVWLNGRMVDYWDASSALPYLVAMSGNNEKQIGVNSVLYGTGNNIVLDPESQLLSFVRPVVDSKSVQVKLPVYSDLLNHIGIINDKLEIIVDWNRDAFSLFCPVNPAERASTFEISLPYLSFETMKQDFPQPDKVVFRQWMSDEWTLPAIGSDNKQQQYEIRSNAFMNKKVHRLLLSNLPLGYNSNADTEKLYNLFGPYMSVPQKLETWNIAKEGRNILAFRNTANDAVKMSITHDTWGPAYLTSAGHYHSNFSPVLQLQTDPSPTVITNQLNGFGSWGCVEINDTVYKDLALSYRRTSDVNATWPSLGSQLSIKVVAEVLCMLVNGEKVFL